jgi:hypothetical protein
MTKIIFALAILVGAFAPAHADPMPNEFVENWCFDYNWVNRVINRSSIDGKCPGEYMKIDRDGYETNSSNCRFTLIEHIENEITKKVANHMFIYTEAKCRGKGKTWTDKQELVYGQIDLLVKPYGKGR